MISGRNNSVNSQAMGQRYRPADREKPEVVYARVEFSFPRSL
jgi:hypothetical protein